MGSWGQSLGCISGGGLRGLGGGRGSCSQPGSASLCPPDLFKYKLINSRLLNSTFLHNKEGCQLDFSDDNSAYMIYFVSFLGTLAVLPGNIVSALLMDKIGRLRMLGKGLGWAPPHSCLDSPSLDPAGSPGAGGCPCPVWILQLPPSLGFNYPSPRGPEFVLQLPHRGF